MPAPLAPSGPFTGRGWAIVAAAVVSLIAGWVLGLKDLFVVGAGLAAALNSYGEFDFPGLGKWDYSKPLAAYGGLRIFNPYEYISKVDANGNVIPIDPDPFDISSAPTK